MDASAKMGIEEILRLSKGDREKFYDYLEERTNRKAADTIRAMATVAGWLKNVK